MPNTWPKNVSRYTLKLTRNTWSYTLKLTRKQTERAGSIACFLFPLGRNSLSHSFSRCRESWRLRLAMFHPSLYTVPAKKKRHHTVASLPRAASTVPSHAVLPLARPQKRPIDLTIWEVGTPESAPDWEIFYGRPRSDRKGFKAFWKYETEPGQRVKLSSTLHKAD